MNKVEALRIRAWEYANTQETRDVFDHNDVFTKHFVQLLKTELCNICANHYNDIGLYCDAIADCAWEIEHYGVEE